MRGQCSVREGGYCDCQAEGGCDGVVRVCVPRVWATWVTMAVVLSAPSGCHVPPVDVQCVLLDGSARVRGRRNTRIEGPQVSSPLLIVGSPFPIVPSAAPPPEQNPTQSPAVPPLHCGQRCPGPPALLRWCTGLSRTGCPPPTAQPSPSWHTPQ